jgi:hypothetical protein
MVPWRALDAHNRGVETQNVAGYRNSQDKDPVPHLSEQSEVRIRVKGKIGIRIRIKLMRPC